MFAELPEIISTDSVRALGTDTFLDAGVVEVRCDLLEPFNGLEIWRKGSIFGISSSVFSACYGAS